MDKVLFSLKESLWAVKSKHQMAVDSYKCPTMVHFLFALEVWLSQEIGSGDRLL